MDKYVKPNFNVSLEGHRLELGGKKIEDVTKYASPEIYAKVTTVNAPHNKIRGG